MDATPTLLERMRDAGFTEQRARDMLRRGWVKVAGRAVTDPEARVPVGTRWLIHP